MSSSIAWHYTIGIWAETILKDGKLKPTTTGIPPDEKGILWCSTNPYWELTANKRAKGLSGEWVTLTMEETAEHWEGLVRFGIPLEKLTTWPLIGQNANMKSKIRKNLDEVAIRQGANFREWYGTLKEVSVSECVSIERMNMGTKRWEPYDTAI